MHSGKLVPMNTRWFVSMMSTSGTRCPTLQRKEKKKKKKTKTAAQSSSTLKTDTRQHRCAAFFTVYVRGLFVFQMRQASGTEPICPLPLLGLHQNNSGQVIYRQYMKYGSYLIEGKKKSAGGFYAVCEIHVTAEWVRDRDDCLWDGAGMRRHHRGNMCMLPVLVSWSSMDTTA